MKLAQATLNGLMLERPLPTPQNPQGLCLDRGYDYDEVRELVAGLGFTAHLRRRGEEQRDIRELGYRARRWVVERTHGWLNRFRGLLIRWAKKAENYLAFVHLACGIITWRATGLLG
jgi:transposase